MTNIDEIIDRLNGHIYTDAEHPDWHGLHRGECTRILTEFKAAVIAEALDKAAETAMPMVPENCPICKYRQNWNGIASHSPECINIDFESAKYYVSEYVKRRDRMRELASRFRCEAQRWEGKCSILRHENNVLRRKFEKKASQ